MKLPLDKLAESKVALEKLDDALLRVIGTIEHTMHQLVNVRLRAAFTSDEWLVWGKHKGEWQFYIEGQSCPNESLKKMPRDVRAAVFEQGIVAKLVTSAVEQLDGMIKQREQALFQADRLIEALGKAADK